MKRCRAPQLRAPQSLVPASADVQRRRGSGVQGPLIDGPRPTAAQCEALRSSQAPSARQSLWALGMQAALAQRFVHHRLVTGASRSAGRTRWRSRRCMCTARHGAWRHLCQQHHPGRIRTAGHTCVDFTQNCMRQDVCSQLACHSTGSKVPCMHENTLPLPAADSARVRTPV